MLASELTDIPESNWYILMFILAAIVLIVAFVWMKITTPNSEATGYDYQRVQDINNALLSGEVKILREINSWGKFNSLLYDLEFVTTGIKRRLIYKEISEEEGGGVALKLIEEGFSFSSEL